MQVLVLRGGHCAQTHDRARASPALTAPLPLIWQCAFSSSLRQVYVNAAAAEAHRDFPHFKLWTDFKATGVISSVSSKPMFTPWGFTEEPPTGESSD